jgi:hypothetical protein
MSVKQYDISSIWLWSRKIHFKWSMPRKADLSIISMSLWDSRNNCRDGVFWNTFLRINLIWFRTRLTPPISYCFTDIPSLIQLDLRHNRIGGILHSGYFYKSSSLQQLFLSFNKINIIERGTFDGLIHLKIVDLTYNNISTISPRNFIFYQTIWFYSVTPVTIKKFKFMNVKCSTIFSPSV